MYVILDLALMMSGFKSEGTAYSPAAIKRTVIDTATPLGSHDSFSVGHGVIQVCFECRACVNVCVCVCSSHAYAVGWLLLRLIRIPHNCGVVLVYVCRGSGTHAYICGSVLGPCVCTTASCAETHQYLALTFQCANI